MTNDQGGASQQLPHGVMLNAYPDSIGEKLSDTIGLLQRPELDQAFSMFYILPTFFHSDLDRGFSIIDYDINEELVGPDDIAALDRLGIGIKLDLVLNHLSVRSPQFLDMLQHGDESPNRDFFIDWNKFWEGHGTMGADGQIVPDQTHLDKLFMRKPGMPTLRVRFPNGSLRTYWNTFYQKVSFDEITASDFEHIRGIKPEDAAEIAHRVRIVIKDNDCIDSLDLRDLVQQNGLAEQEDDVIEAVCRKREYLGQMDLNARSEKVWEFYDETLRKLSGYGAKLIRLDAFAYLHKEPGQPNFFNRPGTWEYLQRLRDIAGKYGLTIFPEIHSQYGAGIHEEIAREGYPIYDFFFPGLVIHTLEHADKQALVAWIMEIEAQALRVINMLGCHDGIPLLDLRGKQLDGMTYPGLLDDKTIDATMELISERGGRTKNLYGADGKKIDYYQINATFYSALGEDDDKMLLARAIQMFMPGMPQIWYLDLFVGKNDYAAADAGRTAGHKEINRTTLTLDDIEERLAWPVVQKQIELIRLRNQSPAFHGELTLEDTEPDRLHMTWSNEDASAILQADLRSHRFTVRHQGGELGELVISNEA